MPITQGRDTVVAKFPVLYDVCLMSYRNAHQSDFMSQCYTGTEKMELGVNFLTCAKKEVIG